VLWLLVLLKELGQPGFEVMGGLAVIFVIDQDLFQKRSIAGL